MRCNHAPQFLSAETPRRNERVDLVVTVAEGWGFRRLVAGISRRRFSIQPGFQPVRANRVSDPAGSVGYKGWRGETPLAVTAGTVVFRPRIAAGYCAVVEKVLAVLKTRLKYFAYAKPVATSDGKSTQPFRDA
jgi:hypothetical protein